jgi:hypothetical protein
LSALREARVRDAAARARLGLRAWVAEFTLV